MKNLFKITLFALLVSSFAACDPKSKTEETVVVDSTNIDSVKIDSVKIDTLKTDSVKK